MLFAVQYLNAESINLYDISTSNFPEVKAKLFVLDNSGNQITKLSASSFTLTENSQPIAIKNISCNQVANPQAISSVLTIDISASMKGKGLDLAKAAAKEWLELFPYNNSECAVSSFNHNNYINCDLTNNKSKLLKSIENFLPDGGTNFNTALIDSSFGALLLLEKAKNQKIVVLLTDGEANGNQDKIINLAKSKGIKVFSVVIGIDCPEILKNISSQTGGYCFNNIQTIDEIKSAYRTILSLSRNLQACEISWISNSCSQSNSIILKSDLSSISASASYDVPLEKLPSLSFDKQSYYYGKILFPFSKIEQFILKANNSDFNINSFSIDNTSFKIDSWGGSSPPFTLKKGEVRNINIKFEPTDTLYTVSKFKLIIDKCFSPELILSGGSKDTASSKQLEVIYPNGGELILAESKTKLIWSGVSPEDSVLIEIKNPNGKWDTVSSSASKLSFNWLAYPNEGNYLLRLRHLSNFTDLSKIKILNEGTTSIKSIAWNPSGDKIAIAQSNRVFVRDYTNWNLYRTISTSENQLSYLRWNPTNQYIARAGNYDHILVWNSDNSSDVAGYRLDTKTLNHIAWSPDGTTMAVGSTEGNVYIWNTNETKPSKVFSLSGATITHLQWSPDGQFIYTSSNDGRLLKWNASNASLDKNIVIAAGPIKSFDISNSGKYLAYAFNNKVYLMNLEIFSVFKTLENFSNINKLKFNLDNQYLAISDVNSVIFYSFLENKINSEYNHGKTITDLDWKKDGTELAIAYNNADICFIKTKDLPFSKKTIQIDSSDNYWSIVKHNFVTKIIDFGERFVGSVKDSTIKAVITNKTLIGITIDSIKIVNNDESVFSLNNQFKNTYLKTNDSIDISISFYALNSGLKTSQLVYYVDGKTFESQIRGNGIIPYLSLDKQKIDFGKVNSGLDIELKENILQNISSQNIIIDSIVIAGPDLDQFSLYLDDNIIKSNSTETITTKFKAKNYGRTSSLAKIYFASQTQAIELLLIAEVVSPIIEIADSPILHNLPCRNISSIDSIKFTNSGDGYLKITNLKFSNPDFNFSEDYSNFIIDANKSKYLKYEFKPATAGPKSSEFSFDCNPTQTAETYFNKIVNGFADSMSLKIDYNTALINIKSENKDTIIKATLYNKGSIDYIIKSPNSVERFDLISVSKNPIPAQDSSILSFKFRGGGLDSTFTSEFKFIDSCANFVDFTLTAITGAGSPKLRLIDTIFINKPNCHNGQFDTTLYIHNIGTATLVVSDFHIEDEKAIFKTSSNSTFNIKQNDSIPIQITFNPDLGGEYFANMKFVSNDNLNKTVNVIIRGIWNNYSFAIDKDTLDFGTLKENIPSEKAFLIHNNGQLVLNPIFSLNSNQFSFNSTLPNSIQVDGSHNIQIAFKGGSSGNTYLDSILITDNCNKTKYLYLTAKVQGFADFIISLPKIETKADQIIKIPVKLEKFDSFILSKIDSIYLDLVFHTKLLKPLSGFNSIDRTNNNSIINLAYSNTIDIDSILGYVEFYTLLGDTNQSDLIISNTNTIGSIPIEFEINNGWVKIKDIHSPIDSYIDTELLINSPNPADNFTDIIFYTAESGRHRLYLVNILGITVADCFDQEIISGKQTVKCKLNNLPIGTYIYVLETPSEKFYKKMIIQR